MPNGEISQIQLPNGDVYDIRDGNVSDFKTNIDEETLSDGQVVKYNEDTGEWENTEDKTEHTGSASGAVATFTTDAALPLKSFECSIVAQQASGTPTPASPLSITGFSQADIPVTGKNLFDGQLPNISSTIEYRQIKLGNGTYTMSTDCPLNTANASNVFFFGGYATSGASTATNGVYLNNPRTVTTTDGYITVAYRSASGVNPINYTFQIEKGDTATTYEPYKGYTYLVEFGQTIYGGRLIYSNGQWNIEATHSLFAKNSSTMNNAENYPGWTNSGIKDLVGTNVSRRFRSLLNVGQYFSVNTENNVDVIYLSRNDYGTDMTQTAWQALNIDIQILVPLKTPVIIPITSTTKVKTIAGLNNIYSNTGDVSLEYYKNTIPAQVAAYNNTSSGLTSTNVQSAIDELSENGLKITNTASGTVALFSDGGDDIPVKSFECSIVAQQESGTPTPSSPLPITGFSQDDIVDISDVTNITYFNGVLEGKYGFVDLSTLTYTITSWGAYRALLTNAKLINNTTIFSGISENYTPVSYNNLKDNLVNNGIATSMSGGSALVYIVASASPTGYLIYELKTPVTPTITPEQFVSLCNAFGIAGALYTVSFGQTIYGGRLIYQNGQWAIEADKAMTLISDLTWSYNSESTRFSTSELIGIVKNAESTSIPLEGLSCECYVNDVAGSSRQIDLSVAVNTTGITLLKDTNYTDVSSLLSAVGNYKIVYPLKTPVIIPLTSTVKVKTIAGLNNIYSNTGDVSLEYFVNKADDIDKLINAEKSTESSDYHVYSTDEQVVGKWIDGNDIYEKTYMATFTNIAQNTPQDMVDVSGLGIADIIRVFGSCKYDSTTPSVQPTLYECLGGHFYCYVFPSGYLQFGQTMTSQTTGRTYEVKVTIQYTKTSSNTRSLNLSKGSSEELPVEEKKEVKEVQDE